MDGWKIGFLPFTICTIGPSCGILKEVDVNCKRVRNVFVCFVTSWALKYDGFLQALTSPQPRAPVPLLSSLSA